MNVNRRAGCGAIRRAQKLPNELRIYSNDGKPNHHTVEKTDRRKRGTTCKFFSCRLNSVRHQRSNDTENHATGIQCAQECARQLLRN